MSNFIELIVAVVTIIGILIPAINAKKNKHNKTNMLNDKLIIILYFFIIICGITMIFIGIKKEKNELGTKNEITDSNIVNLEDSKKNTIQNIKNDTDSGIVQNSVSGNNSMVTISHPKTEPQLHVNFISTSHKEQLNVNGIYLYYTKNIDTFKYGIMDEWRVKVENIGNGTAEDIKIKIQIEGIFFEDENSDFSVDNHITAIGGFSSLVYTIPNSINPGESFELPRLPAEIMHLTNDQKDLTKTSIVLSIYANDMVNTTISNPLYVSTQTSLMFMDDYAEEQEVIRDKILDFVTYNQENMVDGIGIYKLHLLNPDNMLILESKIENYQYIYNYMLNNIYTDNEDMAFEFKKNTIFWGRIYYRCLYGNEDKNRIEMMINNDLESHVK